MDGTEYRYCDHCKTMVPVTRKMSRAALLLLALMLASAAVTLAFFPRFIFIFIFLPFGWGIWKKASYCTVCGRRIRPQSLEHR
jgi:predicted nucleic acid-binding Zn ribbon protein